MSLKLQLGLLHRGDGCDAQCPRIRTISIGLISYYFCLFGLLLMILFLQKACFDLPKNEYLDFRFTVIIAFYLITRYYIGLTKKKIHRKFSLDILQMKNWCKVGARPIFVARFLKGNTKIEKEIYYIYRFSTINMWF